MYKRRELEERQKLELLTEAYETVNRTISEYADTVKNLQRKIPLTEKSLQDAERQLNVLQLQQRKLEIEKRKKWSDLEDCRSSMQASTSRGRVLDSLMQQKREGNCPGLFGRLVGKCCMIIYI